MKWPLKPARALLPRPTVLLPRSLTFYADGAITPHKTGVGAVAVSDNGAIVLLANRTLKSMTNNEAEYQGLLLVFELAAAAGLHATPIEVRMDSEIVIYQMKGRFSVHSPALKALHREACARLATFTALRFLHIPREQNRLADALAGEATMARLWTVELPKQGKR
jgi:probable phosphoglycerate mutase